jgi:hypothetical protein
MQLDDIQRELDKIKEAVDLAVTYHEKDNEKNAALHCSPKVLYSPLTARLQIAQQTLRNLKLALLDFRAPVWSEDQIQRARTYYEKHPIIRTESDDSYSTWSYDVPWRNLTANERHSLIKKVINGEVEEEE